MNSSDLVVPDLYSLAMHSFVLHNSRAARISSFIAILYNDGQISVDFHAAFVSEQYISLRNKKKLLIFIKPGSLRLVLVAFTLEFRNIRVEKCKLRLVRIVPYDYNRQFEDSTFPVYAQSEVKAIAATNTTSRTVMTLSLSCSQSQTSFSRYVYSQ